MPFSPDEFHKHALSSADAEGRPPLSRITAWSIFPFEPEGLRVVPLRPPVLPEARRRGEDGQPCESCRDDGLGQIWEDDHWRLVVFDEPSGAPLVMVLLAKEHYDLPDLPDERASELGKLIVHVARAVESLPHIARAHVSRWGDGGAHVHVFFFARPEGFEQLRGTCFAIWDDLLAPTERLVRDADARQVAANLIDSYGGRALV